MGSENDFNYVVTKMEACISDVSLWVCRNFSS